MSNWNCIHLSNKLRYVKPDFKKWNYIEKDLYRNIQ